MGDDGGERLGLVLVHGFGSSPDMWGELRARVAQDPALGFVDVLPFGYSTGLWRLRPLSRIPGFTTVADSLKEYLDTEGEAHPRLMVVTHSQGGLAVQRYLGRMTAEGRGRDLRRIRQVVLLACPNNGSQVALSLRRTLLRGNPQERQLRPLDEEIAEVQRAVLRDVVYADKVTAHSCPIPFSVYAGESDGVVPPASARSTFPQAAALPGDHFTIARTTGPEHRTFTTLRRLMLLARTRPLPGDPVQEPSLPPPPLSPPPQAPPARAVGGGPPLPAAPPRAGTGGPPLPGALAVVAAAEGVSGLGDPAVRQLVITLMRHTLPDFWPATAAHPRDHLVAIVEACLAHRDPRAALLAFREAVSALRPDDAATERLRALIG